MEDRKHLVKGDYSERDPYIAKCQFAKTAEEAQEIADIRKLRHRGRIRIFHRGSYEYDIEATVHNVSAAMQARYPYCVRYNAGPWIPHPGRGGN